MTGRGDGAAAHDDALSTTLLASLGLPAGASLDDVHATRDRLALYLDTAPPELRPWAQQQAANAEAAYQVLNREASSPSVPTAAPPVPAAAPPGPAAARPTDAGDAAADVADVVGDDADESPWGRRGGARTAVADGTAVVDRLAADRAATSRRMAPLLAVLVVVGVVLGVYFMGGAPADPAEDQAPTTAPTLPALDEARVAELEAAVAANPQDVDARLALGVALFNTSDLAGAEEHWTAAAALAPESAEVHYNLGFLYLSMDPPQVDRAQEEWTRVIEIDPESPLARTAATHLDNLTGDAPSPTTTGD